MYPQAAICIFFPAALSPHIKSTSINVLFRALRAFPLSVLWHFRSRITCWFVACLLDIYKGRSNAGVVDNLLNQAQRNDDTWSSQNCIFPFGGKFTVHMRTYAECLDIDEEMRTNGFEEIQNGGNPSWPTL